ncbi:transporter substrate-binding domain-containing protein [Planktothrix mougeotii]|uniref:Transporter substrate-binding domain-containing protein n=1 Tax=Planktothrix mougeotii LEGE 06226 TaxID=1828728 RepID=A0ABR9UAE9_9CYAN|nr:transporter substrate-binding domain-containing protein [Planktothrix mougeotii]MBE9142816.1 transporter substrate-binding domain-containing protein [Planktothrix mougeotii LEGE 06226]
MKARFHKIFKGKILNVFFIIVVGIGILFPSLTSFSQTHQAPATIRETTTLVTVPSSSPNNPDAKPPESTPELSLGSYGTAVKQLQKQLKQNGYFTGPIDGIYDQKTELAVYNFQISMGLLADGVVGQDTLKSLNNSSLLTAWTPVSTPLNSASNLPPDIQGILDRGILIVAVLGTDNPPFFSENSQGELTGLDIDLGQAIATELGVKVKFDRSAKVFNEVVDLVYQHKADIGISKLSISMARAKKVLFSSPYVSMRQGLLVNRLELAKKAQNKRPEEVIQNLDGKLGVIQGTQYALFFAKTRFPQAQVVEFETWEDVVEAVKTGEVLAAYRDELEVKKIVLAQPDSALDIQTVALTDTKDALAMVLPWDYNHFLAFVNTYLDLNNLNYTVEELINKYPDIFKQES